ncbi:hypothetical protein PTKIN_Ptkin17bG0095500 [Pterospermum kingtungense]
MAMCWAAMTQDSSQVVFPEINSLSPLFPPRDLQSVAFQTESNGEKFLTRRLVFDASKILMLKAKCASTDVPQPTRVEAVTAILWKCARAAATSNRDGITKPSALGQAVNFRKRLNPPQPEKCIGNLVSAFIAKTPYSETELKGLVQQLRNGIREFSENLSGGSDAVSAILETLQAYTDLSKRDEIDFYSCSSGYSFELYADFGWGKPTWVSQIFLH